MNLPQNLFTTSTEQPLKTVFTKEESLNLSQCRIIQKQLVHFQGFPDYLYNEEILSSPKYFGQYGIISKITLINRPHPKTKKPINSAYITFASKVQAAYCILAVDSIKIDNLLVRAFFGTSKYCNHFLNNKECPCEEKCIFLHYLANKNDVINDKKKFGYSDHIKLAKKIISFGSYKSQLYVEVNKYPGETKLPNIKTIYSKEIILIKTKNHRRINSVSENSSETSSSDTSDNQKKNIIKFEEENLENNKNFNLDEYKYFKSKKNSRFFNVNENNSNAYLDDSLNTNFKNYNIIINNIINKNYSTNNKEDEYNFCINLYKKTKDFEILKLLEKSY